MESALEDINKNTVLIAREIADEYGIMAAGNLCNTWVYDLQDASTHTETRERFEAQIQYQTDYGTDFFIAETVVYLGEAKIALEAIKTTGKPFMITLGSKRDTVTLDGIRMEEAFKVLEDSGADIVGLNCFRDPERMLPLAQSVRKNVSCYVATQPVAFRCTDDKPYFQIQESEGQLAFPTALDPFVLTGKEMPSYAIQAEEMGMNYIGSCCGTTPHHIRAMSEALGRTVPNSKYSPEIHLHTIIGDEEHIKEKDERILYEQHYGKI